MVAAVRAVAGGANAVKAVCAEPDTATALAIMETDLAGEGALRPDGSVGTHGTGEAGSAPLPPPAEGAAGRAACIGTLTDALVLLQACTLSARLSGAMLVAGGVPALVRCLALLAPLKPAAMGEEAQEEALMRASAALCGLARLAVTNWGVGIPGLHPVPTSLCNALGGGQGSAGSGSGLLQLLPFAATPPSAAGSTSSADGVSAHRRLRSGHTTGTALAAVQGAAASSLQRSVVFRILTKALNARPGVRGHVAASALALGVLCLVQGPAVGRGSVAAEAAAAAQASAELAITASMVEAVAGGLRIHVSHPPFLQALATSLGCLALAGRAMDAATGQPRVPAPPETPGSAAVCSRGGSRQLIRELQAANAAGGAPWASLAGQGALCALLRALLLCAETGLGSEMLKKQGAVEALIGTLDGGATGGGAGGGEEGVSGGGGGTSSGPTKRGFGGSTRGVGGGGGGTSGSGGSSSGATAAEDAGGSAAALARGADGGGGEDGEEGGGGAKPPPRNPRPHHCHPFPPHGHW